MFGVILILYLNVQIIVIQLCCYYVVMKYLLSLLFSKVMGANLLGIFSAMVKVDRPKRKRPFPTNCNWLMEFFFFWMAVDLEWLNTKMSTVFIGFDLWFISKKLKQTISIQERKHIKRQMGSYILITFVYLTSQVKASEDSRGHI